MQAASLQLADALQAQEQWDANVMRPHDGALAWAIAACNEWEWQERGDWMEQPLDTSSRPVEPIIAGCWPSSSTANTCSAAGHDTCRTFRTSTTAPAAGSSSRAAAGSHSHHHNTSSSTWCSSSSHFSSWATNSSYRAGASGSGSSGGGAGSTVQCAICFDSYASSSMLAAYLPPEAASSSSCTGCCPHQYCRDCMRSYVRAEVQSRKFPIHCADPGCHLELGVDDIMKLLADDTPALQLFEYLIEEHLIDTERRVYCPYKDCSVLLERPELDEEMVDAAGNQEAPYECPSCKRHFCLNCSITGWHIGLSCQQFQALPPELRSAEDAAVHHIARSKLWKRCPAHGCGHLAERSEGCNHMHCLCGCSFCYSCGVAYRNTQPTADNEHGTPGCSCALFTMPEEEEEADDEEQQQVPVPVVLHQADVRHAKPWRNGRFVSRTRCRHSASIFDCPNGPQRCWFWHDEDGE